MSNEVVYEAPRADDDDTSVELTKGIMCGALSSTMKP